MCLNHKVGTQERNFNFETKKLGFTFGREIIVIVRKIGLLYFINILFVILVKAMIFVYRMDCTPGT